MGNNVALSCLILNYLIHCDLNITCLCTCSSICIWNYGSMLTNLHRNNGEDVKSACGRSRRISEESMGDVPAYAKRIYYSNVYKCWVIYLQRFKYAKTI